MALNLADLFEAVADAVPDRVALVTSAGRLTYAQLDGRANRVAHHLLDAGVEAGDHVAVYSWNRAEWVETMLGCYKARAVPINVNYRYVLDELAYLLDDADAVAIVHERGFSPLVQQAYERGLPRMHHRIVVEDGSTHDAGTAVPYEQALAASDGERGFEPRSPDDRYLLYTGGTTGTPKGVVWRQEDIFLAAMGGGNFGGDPVADAEELVALVAADRASSRTVVTPPMMHGGGQWVTFINLFGGHTVILYDGHAYDPHEIWRTVERERATSVMIVGDAMGRPLGDALSDPSVSYDTSSVTSVGSGGAILSKAVKSELREKLPGAVVVDSFGASETGAAGTVMDMGSAPAGARFTVGAVTSVLDEDLRPVAPGSAAVGRLAKRGPIPLGYYKDEDRTRATFPTDPDGTRWVVPGDFATVDADGRIVLLGRGSVSINSGGEKIFPEEVEAVLKSHPDVFDAVVVGVPDDRFGERVAAIVEARPGTTPTLESLASHCRLKVASYKVPRRLRLMESIVRTPAGKPDYRWARSQMQDA